MLQKTLDIITKAGASENIERWSWWTPTQHSLLELAERLSRVILIGGNGTGKTVMLDAFAKSQGASRGKCNLRHSAEYKVITSDGLAPHYSI